MPARPKTTTASFTRITAATLALVTASAGLVLAAGTGAAAAATATATAQQCQSVTALTNGGFEDPAIANSSYQIRSAASVPGWESTDPAGIEIWSNGFNGVPAAAGRQFAELNATQAGTLYQEVATMPGQSLQWSLLHRGRGGTDVMDVLIGAPNGTLASQGNLSDGTSAWGRHTGIYIVPAGQTVTRFGFRAVSTGSGNASIGNFLDDISFGTGPCVVLGTAMTNVTSPGGAVRVGDVLEYTVSAQNQGGSPATVSSLRTGIPAGTAFVAGSLRTTGVVRSDRAGDDTAEIDGTGGTISSRLGSGSTAATGGSVAAGETATLVYRVVVRSAAALRSLTSDSSFTFTDPYTGLTSSTAAPVVVTPVGASADLVVTQIVESGNPLAGAPTRVRYISTITNAGPQDASAVVATVTPPAALADPVVTVGAVPCALVDGTAQCALGSLGDRASETIVVSGTVPASTPAGTTLTSVTSVGSAVHDPDASNSTSTAMATSTAAGDLWLTPSTVSPTVQLGQPAEFTFTVGNNGPSDAADTIVDLLLPAGFVVDSVEGGWDAATATWTIPAMESGTTRSLRVSGPTPDLGAMTGWAGIRSSSIVDTTPDNDQGVAGVVVEAIPVFLPPTMVTDQIGAESPGAAPASEAPLATTAPARAAATVLAMTGASSVDEAALFAGAMLLAGLLVLVLRRRDRGRHRA